MVSHEEGRFLKERTDVLEAVLSNAVAHHIYFRELLGRTWAEFEGPKDAVVDYDNSDENLQASTQ